MRRRARRRHVIVFEVTAIGTCEENVECSYTRVPLIENEHVQHPSLRGLLFSNAETKIPEIRIEILLYTMLINCVNKNCRIIEDMMYEDSPFFVEDKDEQVKMAKNYPCIFFIKWDNYFKIINIESYTRSIRDRN